MTHASNASCFYFPSVHVHGCITAFVPLSLAHSRCQCSSNRLCEQVSKSVTQNHTCWESKGCSLITSNWFSPWNKPNNVASSSAGSTPIWPCPFSWFTCPFAHSLACPVVGRQPSTLQNVATSHPPASRSVAWNVSSDSKTSESSCDAMHSQSRQVNSSTDVGNVSVSTVQMKVLIC